MNRQAKRLLKAIYEKTGGPARGVRDVAELETGLTPEQAKAAWQDLLDEEMITRFSQMYTARITQKGVETAKTLDIDRPRVVVAHGQDTAAPDAVALFLEGAGFEAVRLHGTAVIEQIEAQGELAFAIILLTEAQPPVSVLMELGYLMGRFGRSKVCALAMESATQLPGHLKGVPLELFDPADNWKVALAGHLQAAGG